MIVQAIVTWCLTIVPPDTPLVALYSTSLFRLLQHLSLIGKSKHEILMLPCLEQIKRLEIQMGPFLNIP